MKAVDQKAPPVCLRRTLRYLALGQFQTKLYNNGNGSQSSVVGGAISVICGLIIAIYAVFVITRTLNSGDRTLSEYVDEKNE